MAVAHRSILVLLVLVGAACQGDLVESDQDAPGDVLAGRVAFTESCSGCHASGDGLDLAFFGFSDTTIVRRAVAHVDTATALDIVAHIRSLGPGAEGEVRIFQPRGWVLATDTEFATRLFDADAWPATLTTLALRAIDPRDVAVAVPLPHWSDEQSNMDWMPEAPLPAGILQFSGSAPAAALAGYRAAPTEQNLVRAVQALRTADRSVDNPAAPCILDDATRVDHRTCFDVRRWVSTLVAQHMLRRGISEPLSPVLHDAWWDVGNVVRRSRTGDAAIENTDMNWAAWMYLGWSFDPSRHASVYTGGGLRRIGLPRHATFVALRSQVARPPNGAAVYMDARNAVNFAPDAWVHEVARFGLRHLQERQATGERPMRPDQVEDAVQAIETLRATVTRRLPMEQHPEILTLVDEVLLGLGG